MTALTVDAWRWPNGTAPSQRLIRLHSYRLNRALTAAVVLTLSTGVGVSAAMFNLVDVLLFRPPAHVSHVDRLVDVPSANNFVRYRRLQRQVQSVDLAAYTRMSVTTGRAPDAYMLRAECVTENYFRLLGVTPVRQVPGMTSSRLSSRPLNWRNRDTPFQTRGRRSAPLSSGRGRFRP